MDYFYSLTDTYGYVHSIDNLIFTYYFQSIGLKPIDLFIEQVRLLKLKYPDVKYWEKLGINPCRKYSFFQNAIHLDDGIYLLIGHYVDYDKETKVAYAFPMLRLEINPNKHAQKPIFNDFMQLINKVCYDGVLNRYDYAIDIPLPIDSVQVFGSNKEKGLYKGTRYYGQRNKNGFCRIYDKGKEQNLESAMTRVEHVFSLSKSTKSISFEKVHIKNGIGDMSESVSKTDDVIIKLCALCAANGLDYDDVLNGLDRRKKKTIISHLTGHGYDLLEFNPQIHDDLINYYRNYFGIKELDQEILEDEQGFIIIPDTFNLPFD